VRYLWLEQVSPDYEPGPPAGLHPTYGSVYLTVREDGPQLLYPKPDTLYLVRADGSRARLALGTPEPLMYDGALLTMGGDSLVMGV